MLKILVSYHKPAKLIKDSIFTPIHCGRALGYVQHKDGEVKNQNFEWLLENTIGDDENENISLLNRPFNEITGSRILKYS